MSEFGLGQDYNEGCLACFSRSLLPFSYYYFAVMSQAEIFSLNMRLFSWKQLVQLVGNVFEFDSSNAEMFAMAFESFWVSIHWHSGFFYLMGHRRTIFGIARRLGTTGVWTATSRRP